MKFSTLAAFLLLIALSARAQEPVFGLSAKALEARLYVAPDVARQGGSNSLDLLTGQSLKSYLMPPRRIPQRADMPYYLAVACLEYYVNYDRNYKVNLSPDFLIAGMNGFDWEGLFRQMNQVGTVDAAAVPYGTTNLPPTAGRGERYRIDNYVTLFLPNDRPRLKILNLRKAVGRGNPVLVTLGVDAALMRADLPGWNERAGQSEELPFVVVGFDHDWEMVEVLSPFGHRWCASGFATMSYDDFCRRVRRAYVLVPADREVR